MGAMKKCPHCHKENEDDARYCYYCGALLSKDDRRPSLDDYLPHDSSGAAINPNGERIIEKDDDENEEKEASSTHSDELPEDKKQANFNNNGAPFYDNETGISDEEMRMNSEKEKEGEALGVASICTSFLGPVGLLLGLIGLFMSSKKGKTYCIIGICLSALFSLFLFFLSSYILKEYLDYLSDFASSSK